MDDHRHRDLAEGKRTTLTRHVPSRYKGVNLVVEIKGGRAWLKVWVDGKLEARPARPARCTARARR